MRPRRIRRGMLPVSLECRVAGVAAFNEAPANSPGNAVDKPLMLRLGDIPSMRPRRIRRGMRQRRHRATQHESPSMRPRRIRRGMADRGQHDPRRGAAFNEAPANSPGNVATVEAPARRDHPSMRPRRIRRGMSWLRSAGGPQSPPFNEAPANSPGNVVFHAAISLHGLIPFNEAPANSPGNASAFSSRLARYASLQ